MNSIQSLTPTSINLLTFIIVQDPPEEPEESASLRQPGIATPGPSRNVSRKSLELFDYWKNFG